MANYEDIDRWSQSLCDQADAQPQPQAQPGPRNPGMANPEARAAYADMEWTRARTAPNAPSLAPHATESPCAVPSRPRQPCSTCARIFLQMFG